MSKKRPVDILILAGAAINFVLIATLLLCYLLIT